MHLYVVFSEGVLGISVLRIFFKQTVEREDDHRFLAEFVGRSLTLQQGRLSAAFHITVGTRFSRFSRHFYPSVLLKV